MPYIKKEAREALKGMEQVTSAGELNYLLTTKILTEPNRFSFKLWLKHAIKNYVDLNGESYQTFNDILGAASGALVEYVRRTGTVSQYQVDVQEVVSQWYLDEVGPYEDRKIKENGDVYPNGTKNPWH